MDVREKLVELLCKVQDYGTKNTCEEWSVTVECKDNETVADHLISHGVTVQELDGCKYCKEYEDLPEHFVSGKPVGRVFDTCIQTDENGRWHLEVPSGADIGIKFCPMCGRRLPQPLVDFSRMFENISIDDLRSYRDKTQPPKGE